MILKPAQENPAWAFREAQRTIKKRIQEGISARALRETLRRFLELTRVDAPARIFRETLRKFPKLARKEHFSCVGNPQYPILYM